MIIVDEKIFDSLRTGDAFIFIGKCWKKTKKSIDVSGIRFVAEFSGAELFSDSKLPILSYSIGGEERFLLELDTGKNPIRLVSNVFKTNHPDGDYHFFIGYNDTIHVTFEIRLE